MKPIRVYYKEKEKELKLKEISLNKKILIEYFTHNLSSSFLEGIMEENNETIVLADFYKGLGMAEDYIGLDISLGSLTSDVNECFVSFFLEMLITEKFEENDKGAEFPIAEESVPDIGSLLANRLIDTIIEPGYNKYLDICSNLSDLKAIIALQNINKYLSEYGIEKQFNVDSGSGSLRQFILMLKEEDASMYEAAYKYFDKKLMHEKAETALKKGLSMPLVRIDFWKLAGRRIKDLMEKKNYNEVFNLCNVLNSITDLPREYSTKLLEQQVLAMEAEGSLLEQQGLAKEVAAKFLRVTGTYLKLMERTSGKPEYWAGLHNALCIIYNNHMEKIHKTSSHTFNKVVDAINYLHKHTISNLEIKDIAYDIFLMGGSLNQGEGAYDKAMKLYSDAIKINPKRKEAWDAKLLILDDRNSIYYGPASYKKNRLIKLRNEIFAS